MKTIIVLLASAAIAMTSTVDGTNHESSVLEPTPLEPILIDHGPVASHLNQDTVLEKPAIQFSSESAPGMQLPIADEDLLIVEDYPAPSLDGYPSPQLPATICTTCCVASCCCKSNRTVAEFELLDPCGCTHTACIKVPGCCANESPSVSWKSRLFGRQIATICWECCDYEVKVVVTRRGKVRVRD